MRSLSPVPGAPYSAEDRYPDTHDQLATCRPCRFGCLSGSRRRPHPGPGHAPAQLAFRMGNLLFSGDNIYRDGCVGNIDAHHGSDIPAFLRSLTRIRDSGVEWLLPSHGPIFRNDRQLLDSTIARLTQYQHMADFGTCAIDWPLLDDWEEELARGVHPAQ